MALLLLASAACSRQPDAPDAPVEASAQAEPSAGSEDFDAHLTDSLRAAPEAPERAALLVGVGDYAASGLPDLPGCRNDVQRMTQVLEGRFGFRAEEILTLLDHQATHENIVRAFDRWLLQRAQPETEVIFFLAGHGSRVRDRSGAAVAEPDALDSTFLAFDSRQDGRRGERDLTDDELRSLVAALVERTPRVTVITDSCHSGEVLRGGEARAVPDAGAQLDEEWLREFWPAAAPLTEDAAGQELDPTRYVHIAASRRDQIAREIRAGPPGQERSYGALTYCLTGALDLARPGTTWREVVDDVAARVRLTAHQSVRAEGFLDRELFGGGQRAAFGHCAQQLADPERLEVAAGFLLDLRRGSLLEVWDVRGEEQQGTAAIEVVRADVALARWDEAPPEGAGPAYRVRERSRGVDEPPLLVALESAGLAVVLEGNERVELAAGGEAPYRLRRGATGALVFETTEGIELCSAPLDGDDLDTTRALVSEAIAEESTFLALRALAMERGELELAIDFRPATEEELRGLGLDLESYRPVEVLGAGAERSVSVRGAPRRSTKHCVGLFLLTNRSAVPLHVYVLSLEESRHRELIRTPEGELSIVLAPGETRPHPVAIIAPESWTSSGPMLDRYVALAFDERLSEPRRLEARERTRGLQDELPGVLQRIVASETLRGAPARIDARGWGVAYVDLLVRR